LNKNDEIEGVSIPGQKMARLYASIQLKNKAFVVHDASQQKIREIFYNTK
jgi:hypothetical protein